MGDGAVIHHAGEPGRSKVSAQIRRCALDDFAAGGLVRVRRYGHRIDAETAARRAESRLGETGYNLIGNNCEHFARWCVSDRHSSAQVNGALATGGVGVATYSAAAGGIGVVSAAGTVGGLSGSGIMSGLAAQGAVVGGGAAAGITVLGVLPGAASVAVMNVALRDDDTLPDDERAARRAGRVASIAGGVAGTVGGVGAVSALGVSGLSAAGITSGLASVGAAFGGGMAAGAATVIAAPAIAAAGIGYLAYRAVRTHLERQAPVLEQRTSE